MSNLTGSQGAYSPGSGNRFKESAGPLPQDEADFNGVGTQRCPSSRCWMACSNGKTITVPATKRRLCTGKQENMPYPALKDEIDEDPHDRGQPAQERNLQHSSRSSSKGPNPQGIPSRQSTPCAPRSGDVSDELSARQEPRACRRTARIRGHEAKAKSVPVRCSAVARKHLTTGTGLPSPNDDIS